MLGTSLMGLPLIALGLSPDLLLMVLVAFVAGAGIEIFSMGWNLAMQENVPDEQLSRAYSYDALGSFVAMPVGQLTYGPIGDRFGYAEVMTLSGIAYLVISLLVLCSRSVRDLPRASLTARV
jgi:MFS family permease